MKKTLLAVCIVLLSGCTTNSAAEPNPPQDTITDTEQLQIVASFYPLAYIAERIAGDKAQITNVVGAADPHDYTLSPSDIVLFEKADVVLLQGASLEPWGEDIEKQLSDAGTLTVVAEKLDLHEISQAHKEGDEGHDEHEEDHHEEHSDEHGDEHETGHTDEESHDEHDHGAFDPHTWLDPVLAQEMVVVIQEALRQASPTNADLFDVNASELIEEFISLDNDYKQTLTNCSRSELIFSHDAFSYLAQRYNFTAHAIAGISTQDEPSAKVLSELKQEAAEGITHILTDQTAVDRFAQTLATETGLQMLPINTLATPSSEGEDFFTRTKKNLTQISTAIGCK